MLDVILRGGRIVTPDGESEGDVGIADERVAAVAAPGLLREGRRIIDVSGRLVLPGLVDPHVHLGHRIFIENDWVAAADDFGTGSATAAAGGTTSVIDFAIQRDLDPIETVAKRRGEAEGRATIDYSLHPALTRTTAETLAAIPALMAAGMPSFKLYMIYRKQGRMADDAMLLNVLDRTRPGGLVGVHAENAPIAEFNTEIAVKEGRTTAVDFARTKPNYVEAEAINRAIFLTEHTGGTLYIFHLSTREGLGLVAAARARGVRVYAETCTHYLTLTEEVYHRPDGHRFICSPPLRTPTDVEALWDGIAGGLISVVSSDHCGFDGRAKDRSRGDFTRVPNGLPGVGARLPLIFTHGVATGRLTLPQLVDLLSTNAARIFGMYPRKGTLQAGGDADIVVVDPRTRRALTAAAVDSPVDWTPYEGMVLSGWPMLTIARGRVVAEDGRCSVEAGAGRGRFIERGPAPARAEGAGRKSEGTAERLA